jgi:hypothetical protein
VGGDHSVISKIKTGWGGGDIVIFYRVKGSTRQGLVSTVRIVASVEVNPGLFRPSSIDIDINCQLI